MLSPRPLVTSVSSALDKTVSDTLDLLSTELSLNVRLIPLESVIKDLRLTDPLSLHKQSCSKEVTSPRVTVPEER